MRLTRTNTAENIICHTEFPQGERDNLCLTQIYYYIFFTLSNGI